MGDCAKLIGYLDPQNSNLYLVFYFQKRGDSLVYGSRYPLTNNDALVCRPLPFQENGLSRNFSEAALPGTPKTGFRSSLFQENIFIPERARVSSDKGFSGLHPLVVGGLVHRSLEIPKGVVLVGTLFVQAHYSPTAPLEGAWLH